MFYVNIPKPVKTMQTITLTHKKTLYETIVLHLLSRMSKGRIDIHLPTGELLQMGDGTGGVYASVDILDNRFFDKGGSLYNVLK